MSKPTRCLKWLSYDYEVDEFEYPIEDPPALLVFWYWLKFFWHRLGCDECFRAYQELLDYYRWCQRAADEMSDEDDAALMRHYGRNL